MQFAVTYEDGTWLFEVQSTGDEDNYYESFELTDLNEARDAAFELLEEIMAAADEEDPFDDLFDEEKP